MNKLVKIFNKSVKNLSYDTLLISILVSILLVYMLMTLNDSPVKETFYDDKEESNDKDKGDDKGNDKDEGDDKDADDDKGNDKEEGNDKDEGDDDVKDGAGSNKDGISKNGGKVLVQRVEDKGETTVINNYYGGNKELAKFMEKLLQQNKQDMNKDMNQDKSLMDQGMCSKLNNQLGTLSLAEYKNTRFMDELKAKCVKQEQSCKVSPLVDQSSLIGTLLTDSKNTRVGDILQQ
jgi:hypothetical protein